MSHRLIFNRAPLLRCLKLVHPDKKLSYQSVDLLNHLVGHLMNHVIGCMANERSNNLDGLRSAITQTLTGSLLDCAMAQVDRSLVMYDTTHKIKNIGLVIGMHRAVHAYMKPLLHVPIGKLTVAMAALCEYVLLELLEKGGNQCDKNRRMVLTPEHIDLGIDQDEELELLRNKIVKRQ